MVGAMRSRGRPLADWVGGCVAPALARYGFGQADIVTGWADIAGARVARFAEPVEIKWPRGTKGRSAKRPDAEPPSPATLVVRVEGMFALELQHLAPMLIARINAHLGWRCIGKIALRQAPLRGRPAPPRPPAPPPAAAVEQARILTGGIDDEALRDALVRLGARALKVR